MRQALPRIKALILIIIDFLYPSWAFKVKKNKVVATSFRGASFSGNSALVVKALLRQSHDLDIVWLAVDPKIKLPERIRVVKYNSLASYYELATAHFWIDDFRKKYFPRKKRGQIYYQLWHGVMPLKKVEADAEATLDPMYLREAKRDGQISDFMTVGNEFTAQVYESAFWFNGQVLRLGTPSLDFVFQEYGQRDIERVKRSIGMDPSTHVLLYCPTFREKFNLSDYEIQAGRLRESLHDSVGGNWQVLVRLHPNARKYVAQVLAANPGAIDVTSYPDLGQLIMSSDMVVTDFSSVMFNALYADRPTLLFTNDYEDYIHNERGVYDVIHDLPFPVSKNVAELLTQISTFDKARYQEKRAKFLQSIGDCERGDSAERIADRIHSNSVPPVS